MPEIIDDLVVLGMAVPERTSDGRKTVCMAGYSPSRGFIRIHPCRPDSGLKRWDILRLEVERDRRDTRHESWSIVNSEPEWERLNNRVEVIGHINSPDERRELVTKNISPCVSLINEERDSLGIVQATTIHRAYFDDNQQFIKPLQLELLSRPGEWAKPKADFPREPRLNYSCSKCKNEHNQKVLEWGAFEWMRKNPENLEQYWENARLYSTEHDLYLLVGNQLLHRNAFLVINIIPIKRGDKKTAPTGARYAKQLALF